MASSASEAIDALLNVLVDPNLQLTDDDRYDIEIASGALHAYLDDDEDALV
jgi:hypothetical protein